ncbi:type II toxin-antitoxin system death-on-curing family toxin [Rhodococcus spongiicola]|uniref:Type II toxin-antitoxin system death-on-curing family toxin n=1 Tax=Rhodococcus spongiicola TaxID=2487352 RepID=A0A3S3AF53_9NOCA|nr:type II toxin-antitoxin system death-on-curing family toxin [Rhodococcus spongiicola]RVW03223.1 type II toxin-antitoxin system death-on-curing family toxin [Rhodococcus spongiicola]
MIVYLDREDVLACAASVFGQPAVVRDFGLLDAAIARAQSTVFGQDAYPGSWMKAAALLHSIARNHALADGNKRTAWNAAWLFLAYNGIELAYGFDVDVAEQLMNDAAEGVVDVEQVGDVLQQFREP